MNKSCLSDSEFTGLGVIASFHWDSLNDLRTIVLQIEFNNKA